MAIDPAPELTFTIRTVVLDLRRSGSSLETRMKGPAAFVLKHCWSCSRIDRGDEGMEIPALFTTASTLIVRG